MIAAMWDLEPVDALIPRLKDQALPMWFIHAKNDEMCPHDVVAEIVEKLRACSKAEIRFTSYQDTWSRQGHCADRVAFFAKPLSEGQEAHGEELFSWLASCERGSA